MIETFCFSWCHIYSYSRCRAFIWFHPQHWNSLWKPYIRDRQMVWRHAQDLFYRACWSSYSGKGGGKDLVTWAEEQILLSFLPLLKNTGIKKERTTGIYNQLPEYSSSFRLSFYPPPLKNKIFILSCLCLVGQNQTLIGCTYHSESLMDIFVAVYKYKEYFLEQIVLATSTIINGRINICN